MKRKPTVWDDPVVAEVRAVRARIWKEAGGTMEGLLRLLDERVPVRRPRRKPKRVRRRQAI